MADNMTAGKRLIDPAPVISKLADRVLHADKQECSLLGEVIGMLMAEPLITHVEQRWIPVTERLPEDDGDYLTTCRSMGVRYYEVLSFAKDGEKVDYYDLTAKKDVWYEYLSEYGYVSRTNITHWMPLPEPPALEVK